MPKDELREIRQTPNKHLIKQLKTALEFAESGEMQGMVVANLWTGGRTSYWWSLSDLPTCKTSHVIGELHCVITRLSNMTDNIYEDIKQLKEITNAP